MFLRVLKGSKGVFEDFFEGSKGVFEGFEGFQRCF